MFTSRKSQLRKVSLLLLNKFNAVYLPTPQKQLLEEYNPLHRNAV
jgi:hypothetical protein